MKWRRCTGAAERVGSFQDVMMKQRNIWFLCPACDHKLVVGAEAGGYRAPCPECGVVVPIPSRSTVWPSWVIRAARMSGWFLLVVSASALGWRLSATGGADAVRGPAGGGEAPAPVVAVVSPVRTESAKPVGVPVQEHEALRDRYEQLAGWMLQNYQGRYPLPERLVSQLRLDPVTDLGEVHPDLVEILRISPQERVMMHDALTHVRQGLLTTERSLVQVVARDHDYISFAVPAFPVQGQSLQEDLFLALEATLGSARFDRMLDVAGPRLREQMHYFGEASRTLTFRVIEPARAGDHPPYLLISDGWMIPDGESVRLTKVTETAVMTLPETYQVYREWLPANFYPTIPTL